MSDGDGMSRKTLDELVQELGLPYEIGHKIILEKLPDRWAVNLGAPAMSDLRIATWNCAPGEKLSTCVFEEISENLWRPLSRCALHQKIGGPNLK